MQSANHTFFELLRFPATELFRVKSSEILCVCRGSLQVIHSKPLNTFLLKIGHLKIALDKTLPVIGAFSDLEKYPAYLFPTFDGFYMIKIMDNKPNIVLNNFETILENTCMFSRREGMEEKLGDVREPTMDTKLAVLSEVYHKVKDTIAVHTFHEKHPNFTLLRTFEDLQNVDSHSVPVIDVSEDELVNTRTELEEVVRNHLSNKYWTHFSKKEGIPSDSYLKYSAFGPGVAQTKGSKSPVESLEEQRPHTDSIGADNIDTVKKEAAVENQEVVGTENQRLPAYEVQSSKDHVEQGLDKASCRLDDAKFYQNCDLPPVPESQIKEDTAFTTDLLKPAEQKDKPESNLTTPLGANGDPYRRELTQDVPLNSLANSEKWGSDVTNPSESAMKLGSELGLSDAAFSTTSENNNDVGTKPVIIGQGLTHSQSLRDTSLGNAAKENLVFKQNPSDKHEMKQKNISEEPLDKENLTTI